MGNSTSKLWSWWELGNDWALFLSGGELSSRGVVLESLGDISYTLKTEMLN